MAKLKHLFSAILVLTLLRGTAGAQSFSVQYRGVEADSVLPAQKAGLDSSFASLSEASVYLARLPELLQAKGFLTASIDSLHLDSNKAEVFLFLGQQYKWAKVRPSPTGAAILEAVQWEQSDFRGPLNFSALHTWQQKILDHLEENGYPFGKVFLDSIAINGDEVEAMLVIDKGRLYTIDSIRVYGEAKVNPQFLQRYLDIANGSTYSKKKLQAVSRKMTELPYVEEERPSDLSLLGTGSVLNLYLKNKKSSQVNALIGFLPNSAAADRKLLLTVDANILLRNAFGSGETIGLLWQQLQQGSPRLNLLFEQPYIFSSPFGLSFSLDMYRRDSTFLNLNMNLGTTYRISERQTGSVFLQRRQTIVNGVNTALVLQSRQLPREADVSSLNLGVSYNFNATDYRFNPRKGGEFTITTTAGTKKIKKNSQILELKDPSNPSFKFEQLYDTVKLNVYQFRVQAAASRFFPVGTSHTIKLGFNAGVYGSANYFRNELFQIGGYKLMRGFDEESQFVSQYGVGTFEYRILIDRNSAVYAFVDGGWGKHLLETVKQHTYLGAGLGMSIETKAGIFNFAWAVGRRDDQPFNLRQSKVHIGFASYF